MGDVELEVALLGGSDGSVVGSRPSWLGRGCNDGVYLRFSGSYLFVAFSLRVIEGLFT